MNEYKYKAGDIVKFYDKSTLISALEKYRSNASPSYKNTVIALHDSIQTIEDQYPCDAQSYTLEGKSPWIFREYMFELVENDDDDIEPIYG